MSDPGDEVEEQVKRIIDEHKALWGCDDPACAVACSNIHERKQPKRPWWKRLFGLD